MSPSVLDLKLEESQRGSGHQTKETGEHTTYGLGGGSPMKTIAVFLLKDSVHWLSIYSLPPLPVTEPVTEADYLLPGESTAFVFLDYE